MKQHTSSDSPILKRSHAMIPLYLGISVVFLLLLSVFIYQLKFSRPNNQQVPTGSIQNDTLPPLPDTTLVRFVVPHDVKIKDYFKFIDSVKRSFDTILPYKLTEYILVRNNPFIIDTLENTDYYRMKLRDTFIYDQKQLVVLKQGDILKIPTLEHADTLTAKMARTRLDINIPEFKLRILEGEDTLYTFPIRVGQNRIRYLSEVGRDIDLRTKTGTGSIVYAYKKDFYIDPVEGKKFTSTKRDDNKRTLMPLQPWLEPKMEGQTWGQLIHPTTNPASLGKAYSNGCIGTREADIWCIYYYAPVGTKVTIRYNLTVRNENGDTVRLKDIYNPKRMLFL